MATVQESARSSADAIPSKSSRGIVWIAVALSVAVIAIFVAQVAWGNLLITPWYLPVGGTVAAVLMAYAVGRRRSWQRIILVVGLVGVAALEWCFLLLMTRLPDYSGPVAAGDPLPAFQAELADGTKIDPSFFRGERPKVLIFFQGHWCPFCMAYLRQLETHHEMFDRRNTDLVVASLDDLEASRQTQQKFPHLIVVSDHARELSTAVGVINPGFAPDGGDSAAPTNLLIDGTGKVRWLYRPARFIARPSAAEIVAEIESRLPKTMSSRKSE